LFIFLFCFCFGLSSKKVDHVTVLKILKNHTRKWRWFLVA